METVRSIRAAALVCVVGTALAALYAATAAVTAWVPSYGFVVQALIHCAELAGLVGLALSGAAGAGLLGRIGLGGAGLGQVLLVAAELIYPGSPDVGDQLFAIAPLLSAVGMMLAGVAVLRARHWTGWRRTAPLLVGLWSLVVLTPTVIVSGGPPAPVALWAIAGWELTWLLLGVAVLTGARASARIAEAPASA